MCRCSRGAPKVTLKAIRVLIPSPGRKSRTRVAPEVVLEGDVPTAPCQSQCTSSEMWMTVVSPNVTLLSVFTARGRAAACCTCAVATLPWAPASDAWSPRAALGRPE
eukprot:9382470-Pyramimonas_sp.AAC.1